MFSKAAIQNELFRLYERYVGEPDSSTDVYGYWLFILGYLLGAAGVLVYVVQSTTTESALYPVIRISGVAAATGLTLCLFGIVLMLPVRRRGVQAGAIGLLVASLGVASFGVVYPQHWRDYGLQLDGPVIAVYTVGVMIIAGVTALVPVLTGKRGMLVEEEGKTEDPPILTGDALEGA